VRRTTAQSPVNSLTCLASQAGSAATTHHANSTQLLELHLTKTVQKDVIRRVIPTERIKMAPTAVVLAPTPALSLKTQASIQAILVPTASHAHWMPLL
jgi:hypothetical protein